MQDWYKIQSKTNSVTDIYIYGIIGSYENPVKNFISEFNKIKSDIIIHINSPGGDVFSGLSMFDVIQNHVEKVTCRIEGLAASMGSILALAGDELEVTENSLFMIHNPFTYTSGDAKRLRKEAELLEKLKDKFLQIYSQHSRYESEEISTLMDKETWFDAKELKENGFADRVISAKPIKNCIVANFTNEKYKNWIKKQGEMTNMEENNEKNNELLALQKEIIVKDVQLQVAKGNIADIFAEFATKLANKDKELYKEFLTQMELFNKQNEKRKAPLKAPPEFRINEKAVAKKDFGFYMENIAEAEKLKQTAPDEYNRLKNEYLKED